MLIAGNSFPDIFLLSAADGQSRQEAPVKGMEILRQAEGWQGEMQSTPFVVPGKCHENDEALG